MAFLSPQEDGEQLDSGDSEEDRKKRRNTPPTRLLRKPVVLQDLYGRHQRRDKRKTPHGSHQLSARLREFPVLFSLPSRSS